MRYFIFAPSRGEVLTTSNNFASILSGAAKTTGSAEIQSVSSLNTGVDSARTPRRFERKSLTALSVAPSNILRSACLALTDATLKALWFLFSIRFPRTRKYVSTDIPLVINSALSPNVKISLVLMRSDRLGDFTICQLFSL